MSARAYTDLNVDLCKYNDTDDEDCNAGDHEVVLVIVMVRGYNDGNNDDDDDDTWKSIIVYTTLSLDLDNSLCAVTK